MPETVRYTLIAFILAFIAVEGLTARKKLAAINQYSAGGLANHLVGRRGSVVSVHVNSFETPESIIY